MANALYGKFKEALLNKEHNLDTDAGPKATLIDKDDYDAASTINTDTTYVAGTNGIPDIAKVAASAVLSSTTIALGVFDSADFTWSTVAAGTTAEAIVLWNDATISPTADALIAWYDSGMTGMPVTTNGGDINVTVNGSGWFSL